MNLIRNIEISETQSKDSFFLKHLEVKRQNKKIFIIRKVSETNQHTLSKRFSTFKKAVHICIILRQFPF